MHSRETVTVTKVHLCVRSH